MILHFGVCLLVLVGITTPASAVRAEEFVSADELVLRAMRLEDPEIDRWIIKSMRKSGRNIVYSYEFQEVLREKIRRSSKAKGFASKKSSEGVMQTRRRVGKQRPPFLPLFGSLGFNGRYVPEHQASLNSTTQAGPIGGGAGLSGGGGSAMTNGSSASLNATGVLMLSPSHQMMGMYMHQMVQQNVAQTNVSGGNTLPFGQTISQPKNIGMLSYNGNQVLDKNWSFTGSLSYMQLFDGGSQNASLPGGAGLSSGFTDSNLRFVDKEMHSTEEGLVLTTVSMGATLPFSKASQNLSQVTTLSVGGSRSLQFGPWSLSSNANFGYTFYGRPETEEQLLSRLTQGQAPSLSGSNPSNPANGQSPFGGLDGFDLNWLSREVSHTQVQGGLSYKLHRQWFYSAKVAANYSYLESTYSSWSTQATWAGLAYQTPSWSTNLSLQSSAPATEKIHFPNQLGIGLTLTYSFGGMPQASGQGAPSSAMPGGFPGSGF